jgi:hypothetical protein
LRSMLRLPTKHRDSAEWIDDKGQLNLILMAAGRIILDSVLLVLYAIPTDSLYQNVYFRDT